MESQGSWVKVVSNKFEVELNLIQFSEMIKFKVFEAAEICILKIFK